MRTIFDERLAEIHRDLLQLGIVVNEAINKAIQAFVTKDVNLAEEIIENDLKINDKENEIDKKCTETIALQQPLATDLRRIIAVIRASSDLERMGDHAQNIAEVTINLKNEKHVPELEPIIQSMGNKIMKMSTDIIDAFVDFNVEAAREIALRDEEVDKHYNLLRLTAIDIMKENPDTAFSVSDYSFIGRDLEPIGDYVTNIGEGIIYLSSGEIVDLGKLN
ncbi:phosphate transport system protein [Atopostipes suicloacalis DSM 15692]|uniref:Phosphate-specific transport system accessory protein PhoU n=1 Tax=Atopostipes suicloacalis DSM 15692 TaxID=1121025 RepID=A0A1M4SH06_9LACT|nr:phosphate signaling complex protein PhoU [Atopostipes suicloacalis]SHE31513.1 phosphate transport system protein [Atopostipes suicloacalis DSM 15692]